MHSLLKRGFARFNGLFYECYSSFHLEYSTRKFTRVYVVKIYSCWESFRFLRKEAYKVIKFLSKTYFSIITDKLYYINSIYVEIFEKRT